MTKAVSFLISVLITVVLILGASLAVFLTPLFQADEMLAQIRIEEVLNNTCYLISLELTPDRNESKRRIVLARKSICGDFIGLGYEFALPEKLFALVKKPGIVITNVVAFDQKTRNQTGNLRVGSYEIEFVESVREQMGNLLKKTAIYKSITYDIRALMKKPQKGAVISYKLEPARQQVLVECVGCKD